jgi:hypothetical protein
MAVHGGGFGSGVNHTVCLVSETPLLIHSRDECVLNEALLFDYLDFDSTDYCGLW